MAAAKPDGFDSDTRQQHSFYFSRRACRVLMFRSFADISFLIFCGVLVLRGILFYSGLHLCAWPNRFDLL